MNDCLLLLGGNVGDRRARLRTALKELGALRGSELLSVSKLYETAPVGPSSRPFYNCAARLRTALSPMGLLVECKRLETKAGRKPGIRWGARPLDIDIIKFNGLKRRTRWLTIPHPRVSERAFALIPLRDIAPRWKPNGTDTIAALCLNPPPETVKIVFNVV